jgi:hypothetical protein
MATPDAKVTAVEGDDVLVRDILAPMHKTAFGAAVGIAAALVVVTATAIQLVRNPNPPFPLHLLAHYFRGYTVSWGGAIIGAFWAGFAGFVAGWFFAFCRNTVLAVFVFVMRTRAELWESRDILDHL